MKNTFRYPLVILALVAGALNNGCASLAKVDAKKEKQAIRDLDTQFGAAAAKKDAEAAVALYASDATILAPDAPPAKGTEAIRAAWTEFLKTPGLAINIVPEKICVAFAGDLATDVGRFEMESDSPQGHLKSVFKYLEVWRKTNGQWKVIYDTWNANAPVAK